jgi:hypothetical protein
MVSSFLVDIVGRRIGNLNIRRHGAGIGIKAA